MVVAHVELRAFGIISRMQPRYAAYEATVADGDIQLAGMAQLFVEVAPGNEVYRLADTALKGTPARPGSQVVEREFGFLELHSPGPDVVEEAGRLILDLLGLRSNDRLRPTIVNEEVITNITPYQAQLINRFRRGSLVIPGQTLLVLETSPASYVMMAANEGERSADIDVIDVRPIGRFGRLYLAGEESSVREASRAARALLESVDGREQ